MGLGTSKYARRRQKKGKEDRSESPNKVQDPIGKTLLMPGKGQQKVNDDRLIGKLTAFLHLKEFNLRNPTVDYSTSAARRSRSP